jgi:hypothetical protein
MVFVVNHTEKCSSGEIELTWDFRQKIKGHCSLQIEYFPEMCPSALGILPANAEVLLNNIFHCIIVFRGNQTLFISLAIVSFLTNLVDFTNYYIAFPHPDDHDRRLGLVAAITPTELSSSLQVSSSFAAT